MRIGINTGYCTVGNFGSDERMDYTIIGNEVNLTARLQSHVAPGGILLAHETYALVKNEIRAEPQEATRLKGLRDPVHAYKVAIPGAPSASFEELIRRRIKVDLAQLEKVTQVKVLNDIQNQVDGGGLTTNGSAGGGETFALAAERSANKASENHG
jgi:hypothetical protein